MSYPMHVRLKKGREVTLRPAQAGDEQRLFDFFASVPDEDRQFLKDDVRNPEVIKGWLRGIDHSQVLSILALDGDKVIADGTLHRCQTGWGRHVAEVRIVVARDWQKQGIAQSLLRELVHAATNSDLELLEAQMLSGQTGAIRAFEALGFRVVATLPNRATDQKGQRRDLLILNHDVTELWQRMEDLITDSEYRPAAGG